MKRALIAYTDFQISADMNEDELFPEMGEVTLQINGKSLTLDFRNTCWGIVRKKDILTFSIEQRRLMIAAFIQEWMDDGLIPENTQIDEIENYIFDYIKESSLISEIYFRITTDDGNDYFEGDILLTSLVIVDVLSGEEIDILAKPMGESALPEGVSVAEKEEKCS